MTRCSEADAGADGHEERDRQVGLSWFLGEHAGHRTASHGGGDTGFRSYILLLPDEGVGIVLASNWQKTDTGALARGILDLMLAAGPEPSSSRSAVE